MRSISVGIDPVNELPANDLSQKEKEKLQEKKLKRNKEIKTYNRYISEKAPISVGIVPTKEFSSIILLN